MTYRIKFTPRQKQLVLKVFFFKAVSKMTRVSEVTLFFIGNIIGIIICLKSYSSVICWRKLLVDFTNANKFVSLALFTYFFSMLQDTAENVLADFEVFS